MTCGVDALDRATAHDYDAETALHLASGSARRMTPPPSPSSPAPLSPAPFTAQLLKTGASGLAALATERLMQERPTLAQRYAPNAKIKWRDNISARIGYLAAAVTTGKAEVFMHHTGWDKVAHASRGGAEACADLEASMHALRQTLSAELPAHASGPALTMLDRAIEHLVRAPTELASSLKAGTTTGRLAAEYLIAVLEGDAGA
jgi:MerR family transcriptional regulator, light-induced transcriptional regulator